MITLLFIVTIGIILIVTNIQYIIPSPTAENVNTSKENYNSIVLYENNTPNDQIIEPSRNETLPSKTGKKKIAYAITVTKDGNFVDGALVLGNIFNTQNSNSNKWINIWCKNY